MKITFKNVPHTEHSAAGYVAELHDANGRPLYSGCPEDMRETKEEAAGHLMLKRPDLFGIDATGPAPRIVVAVAQVPPDGCTMYQAEATISGRTLTGMGESELQAIGDLVVEDPKRFGLAAVIDTNGKPIGPYQSGPVNM